ALCVRWAVFVAASVMCGVSAPIASAKDRPNKPPMVKLRAPASAAAGAPITLDGSSTNDSDVTIASWDYAFGDGTHQSGAGRVIAVQHVFSTPGTYSVQLSATDNDGATNSATASVIITGGTVQPS